MKVNDEYQAIVVGAGHAGIESALALSRLNVRTLVLAISLESVGFLACNPSIGGTAKAHLVREVDALGGEMGRAADATLIQLRVLNRSKGAAVQSLRAQVDKNAYHAYMKKTLENQPNLDLKQGEVDTILASDGVACGVRLTNGLVFHSKVVVLACGVYLRASIVCGNLVTPLGPSGFKRAEGLTASLSELGFTLRRFKTGTPARVHLDSVDLAKLELQEGEGDTISFSHSAKKVKFNRASCYLGWTNKKTHQIIEKNLLRAPLFSGLIEGTGARYCPSIEDKIVRFGDRERHQFFLEPEGLGTKEMYVQGLSSSLPADTQLELYRSIEGFERVKIMRDAYAIEYDCIDSRQLDHSLMSKSIKGLFFAGQINGTSGYEEAAAQGLMAGINAKNFLRGEPPFVLGRDEAYIGVLIDDLIIKGTNEPYRMMTSRAEFRLHLRQDNADIRLSEKGWKIGLLSKNIYARFLHKAREISEIKELLDTKIKWQELEHILQEGDTTNICLRDVFLRCNRSAEELKEHLFILKSFSAQSIDEVYTTEKYAGYLARQKRTADEMARLDSAQIPPDIDYTRIDGIRLEARQKLSSVRPATIGQAARISGVNPADINVLIVHIFSKKAL